MSILNSIDQRHIKFQLESFIDQSSLEKVLELLAEVCEDKAEHIRDNWQDNELALRWERAGNLVMGLTIKTQITKLSLK